MPLLLALLTKLRFWRLGVLSRLAKTASQLSSSLRQATLTKVFCGQPGGAASESKARLMTVELKRNLAMHEAGHAIVSMVHGDDPGRITIMPRGQTGGHYQSLSDTDGMQTYAQLIAMIDMALAGRAAQKVLLGRADTGCSNDLMQANNIAGFLTTQVGMSRLGAIYLPEGEKPGEEIKAVIKELVDERQCVVEALIEEHKSRLEVIVEALLERETLLGFELKTFSQKMVNLKVAISFDFFYFFLLYLLIESLYKNYRSKCLC